LFETPHMMTFDATRVEAIEVIDAEFDIG